jgi:hypothetical protein
MVLTVWQVTLVRVLGHAWMTLLCTSAHEGPHCIDMYHTNSNKTGRPLRLGKHRWQYQDPSDTPSLTLQTETCHLGCCYCWRQVGWPLQLLLEFCFCQSCGVAAAATTYCGLRTFFFCWLSVAAARAGGRVLWRPRAAPTELLTLTPLELVWLDSNLSLSPLPHPFFCAGF